MLQVSYTNIRILSIFLKSIAFYCFFEKFPFSSCQLNLFSQYPYDIWGFLMIWEPSFCGPCIQYRKTNGLMSCQPFFTHMSVTIRPRFLWSPICILGTISICLKSPYLRYYCDPKKHSSGFVLCSKCPGLFQNSVAAKIVQLGVCFV